MPSDETCIAELEHENVKANSDDISYDGQDAIQVAVPREANWAVVDEETPYEHKLTGVIVNPTASEEKSLECPLQRRPEVKNRLWWRISMTLKHAFVFFM